MALVLAALPAQQQPVAAPAAAAPASPLGTADFAAFVEAMCRPLIASGTAIGLSVGVVDGDATLVRGYGRTAPGGAAVPDGATVYEIGSVSKVFTGLLLAIAVERGEVSLQDPVQQHLPPGMVMPRTEQNEVRLWHLTAHVSGLPRLPAGESPDPDDPYAHLTRDKVYAAVAESALLHEPGSTYLYSNLAVGLLGQILVDRAGAPSYGDLLRDRIAGPLGLGDTMVALGEEQRARLAPPFDVDGDPAHQWDLAALAGAGGVHATVTDLLRFARAQIAPQDTPLAAAIARSQQKLHEGVAGMAVACGWHYAKDGATLWHNGQTGGYHGYLAVAPASRRAVAILTNISRGEIDVVGERILQHLFGIAVEPLEPELPVEVAREVLQRYVGVYQLQPGVQVDVALDDRGLRAQVTGQGSFRLFARSPTEFFFRVAAASITFEVDGDAVAALVLHQDGHDTRAPRR